MHNLPAFGVPANVWRFANWVAFFPPDVVTESELILRKPVVFINNNGAAFTQSFVVELWFPPLTDVRGWAGHVDPDVVEFPAGSGRLYTTIYVDDYAKGLPNEFRVAFCTPFQMPVPLP